MFKLILYFFWFNVSSKKSIGSRNHRRTRKSINQKTTLNVFLVGAEVANLHAWLVRPICTLFEWRVTIVNTLRPCFTMLFCQAILASIRVLLALYFGL